MHRRLSDASKPISIIAAPATGAHSDTVSPIGGGFVLPSIHQNVQQSAHTAPDRRASFVEDERREEEAEANLHGEPNVLRSLLKH